MSDDLRWTAVGQADAWADGSARVVQVGARRIAVFRQGGAFHALKDACPHAGVPLSGGYLDGERVVCSAHAWAFSLADGRCVSGPSSCQAVSYAVRVTGGTVEIGV